MFTSTELVTNRNPLTKDIVKKFAASVHVGDVIPTVVRTRLWTANANFIFQDKLMKVEVVNKYSNLVEFEYEQVRKDGSRKTVRDTMRWADMIFGCCRASRVSEREFAEHRYETSLFAA